MNVFEHRIDTKFFSSRSRKKNDETPMPTPSYKYNEWMGRKDRMKYTPRDPRKTDKGMKHIHQYHSPKTILPDNDYHSMTPLILFILCHTMPTAPQKLMGIRLLTADL